MAQLVAHLVWDQDVARSSRVIPTIIFFNSLLISSGFFVSLHFSLQNSVGLSFLIRFGKKRDILYQKPTF